MALDHYVSQVHLRKFAAPTLRNQILAIRKKDLKTFTAHTHSVCRIPEGNTNSYVQDPRAIEEFLRGIEPNYNDAVAKITEPSFDSQCIYALSGFIAYVLTCSPTGMRLQSVPLRGLVEETSRRLDARNQIPAPPRELGGASLTELLDRGTVRVEIDPKDPQALGINQILTITNSFGNFLWDVLINEFDDSPYFTSDFPVAIEATQDPRILNRIVPLSPTVAIKIRPTADLGSQVTDFTYPHFRRRLVKASRQEVMRLNRLIVQCAESLVFFRDNLSWVLPFVRRNATYRLENRVQRLPHNAGTMLWSSLQIENTSAGS